MSLCEMLGPIRLSGCDSCPKLIDTYHQLIVSGPLSQRRTARQQRLPMSLSFLARIDIVCLSVVIAIVMTADNCVAQDPSEIDFKSNPPCVSASSPCQLAFQPLAPAVARQLAEAKKLFEDKDFVGTQTKLEAILVAQPDSKIVLYDLSLTYLKQGQRDKALTYEQQALQGVTHPYQRK